MPKVTQSHLDARRQQIVDAARRRFASHGFARTSIGDLVDETGLSNGAIYRYFASKEDIVIAVCEQVSGDLPDELTAPAIDSFLQQVRAMSRDVGHSRLVSQIYAEAAISPVLAAVVRDQLSALRTKIAALVPRGHSGDAEQISEAFVAIMVGYSEQLAVRGDLDQTPFTAALMAILRDPSST